MCAAFDRHLTRSGVTVGPSGTLALLMEWVSMGQVSVSYGQLQTGTAKYDAGGAMGGEMINP